MVAATTNREHAERTWAHVARRVVVGLLVAAVSATLSVAVPQVATAAAPDPRFPLVADLSLSNCSPTCANPSSTLGGTQTKPLLHVDVARRQLLAYLPEGSGTVQPGVGVVDIDTQTQTRWIDLSSLPSKRFTVSAYDPTRARLFVGERSFHLGCANFAPTNPAGCAEPGRFAFVDLAVANPTPVQVQLPRAATVLQSEQTPPNVAEGDVVSGLAVDKTRDRLYVLTSSGQTFDHSPAGKDAKGIAVHAYRAASLSGTSRPLWTYRVPSCGIPLQQRKGTSYIDAAEDGSFVYLGCRNATGFSVPPGVARIHVDEPNSVDPLADVTTEFFPFAGNILNSGFAIGDPAGDRIAIGVSANFGQRTYVFDARHGAWIGSMLLGFGNVGGGGVDPATGRMYVLDQNDNAVRFMDNAGLPVVVSEPIPIGHWLDTDLTVDPVTRSVFEPGNFSEPSGVVHVKVYEDRTQPFIPAAPRDPDEETHDLPEDEAVQVSHSGAGSAYGARAMWVRGVEGVPFVSDANANLPGPTERFKVEGGDRGLFLGRVAGAQLTGETDRGEATASAAAIAVDEATEADLKGKYGQVTGPLGVGDDGAEQCDDSQPSQECLSYDSARSRAGPLQESACKDFGNEHDPRNASRPGSEADCRRLDTVIASASASLEPAATPDSVSVGIAESDARAEVTKLADGGIKTVSRSTARGIAVTVPGSGALSIGEISTEATSQAAGRPGSAASALDTVAKNVRLTNATGDVLFSCGVPGVNEVNQDGGEQCDVADVVLAINRWLAPRVIARGPRPEMDPLTRHSPGGAQAMITKDRFALWSDATVNGDAGSEVTGLDLTIYNDNSDASRVILQLAGAYAEAQYQIGEPKPPESSAPTKLSVGLVDSRREPLEGGVFQVRDSDPLDLGRLLGACVTGADGIGDCEFEGLAPGEYVVSQTAAPAGYAPADDATISLAEGLHTEVVFTNLRAVGEIQISLTDDGGETGTPLPLQDATFGVLADNGDLVRGDGDQLYDECTTDGDGMCTFEDVPLGPYVVYQKSAPDGYLTADDVGFELQLPGQEAELSFITGLEGIAGTSGSSDTDETQVATDGEAARDAAFVDEPTETTTVIIEEPPMRSAAQVSTSPLSGGTGIGRVIALPSEALGFLRREPLQAVLFGLVWLLLAAPVYLAVRRRTLSIAKEVV